MDELLGAIADLRINGTPEEEDDFSRFKRSVIEMLKDEERAVLKELKRHHVNSFRHSVMVARDVEYVARRLRLPDSKVAALKVAAILHDVGKIDIHEAILDHVTGADLVDSWKITHPKEEMPKDRPIGECVLVRDIIDYKSRSSDDPKNYVSLFKQWMNDRGLKIFIDKSFRAYINHHQNATRNILERLGMSPEIMDYAAGHHPSYFSDRERRKLPPECGIIEVVDKFNAIIQSEGVRHYISKRSRTEALDIIAHEMQQSLGFFKAYEKRALRMLAERYLPPEVYREVLPHAKSLISHMRKNIETIRRAVDDDARKEAESLLALIALTLALSREFGEVLDSSTTHYLEHYEEELENLLGRKAA